MSPIHDPLLDVEVGLLATVHGDDGGPPMLGRRLTMRSMRVESTIPRWPGHMIRIRFKLAGSSKTLSIACRVVDLYQTESGAGLELQFLRLDRDAQLALRHYLERHSGRRQGNRSGWVGASLGDLQSEGLLYNGA